jgi:type IV pilus assembly protein PilY1
MSSKLMKMVMAAFLVLIHSGAHAEDIDLFAGGPTGTPNVLFILDNAANFSANAAECTYPDGSKPSMNGTIGGLEQCAFYAVVKNLMDTGTVMNIGFMAFNANGFVDWDGNTCQSGGEGGCLIVPIIPMNTDNASKLLVWIKSWESKTEPSFPIKTNSAATGAVMQEAWAYFSGRTGISGRSYADIKPISTCGKNYVIYISGTEKTPNDKTGDPGPKGALDGSNPVADKNASPAASPAQRTIYEGPVRTACNSPDPKNKDYQTILGATNHESNGFYADEWARYMADEDGSNITTYTIGIYDTFKTCSPITAGLLSSMASSGNTEGYLVTSAAGIALAIQEALSEIQSVNSVFASASLPVSVNAQGTYLNQIFIGMFRPEEEPRWLGNLKQYQFVAEFDDIGKIVGLKTADKNGVSAISPLTGFIKPCATSFWSTDDAYWPSDYQGNCEITGLTDVSSNSPDGEIVEKGGVAQKLRSIPVSGGVDSRNVLTCIGCGDNSTLDSFNSASLDSDLRKWARGQNVDDERLGKDEAEIIYGINAMRPSVHGDVVHSRPLAIDYGGSTGVIVFYGGNDGMLRAIDGNKDDADGTELWSFVAPEHYSKFNRLRTNSPNINFANLVVDPADPTPQPKDYFFDGPIGVYSSGGTKWIYPTMRRGGSSVYAFDVSNPASPVLKWKRDGTQLANIGQTWSEPKIVKAAGYFTEATLDVGGNTVPAAPMPLIIMGGGYDTCEDKDVVAPTIRCATPKGNRVFILDADTGDVLNTLITDRSVVADITARDSDGDGLVDVAYAVDTGANIYRINIGSQAPENWSIIKIAALGCSSAASCDRKFLHAPEVVVTEAYNAVLVGSGNRERPLRNNQSTLVDNAFFMIKDDVSYSTPDLITVTTTTSTGSLELVPIDPNLEPTTDQLDQLKSPENKGWYLTFGSTNSDPNLDHDKEQVVTSAVVLAGVAYFSTHTPTVPKACGANLGRARGYAVNFLDSSSRDTGFLRYAEFAGGGLAPSPVAGIVEVNSTVDGKTESVKVPFIIGGKPPLAEVGSGIGGALAPVNVSPLRSRVYWYIQQ